MPSRPIATWITPCSSRRVQVPGTSRRRHTIGLIPSSQTLSRTALPSSGAGGFGSVAGLRYFGGRVTGSG
jgi:hypothetical protein